MQKQLDYLDSKIKMEIIRNATFIQLDLGHAKVEKPRENKAKQKKNRLNINKKIIKSHFGSKLHRIIDRDGDTLKDDQMVMIKLTIRPTKFVGIYLF